MVNFEEFAENGTRHGYETKIKQSCSTYTRIPRGYGQ